MPDCKVGIRTNIYKNNMDDFPIIYREFENRWERKNCFIFPAFVRDHGNCKMFPICDGGCNLYRWDYFHKGLPYNICPIDENGIEKYLEIVYEIHKQN